ncbi:UNVERIFIED_CONTAM: hypothetical protein RMT77_009997 [Armadillidium vulgare]
MLKYFFPSMAPKLHFLFIWYVFFTVYHPMNTLFLQQPRILIFYAIPGITCRMFPRSTEAFLDTPIAGSNNFYQLKIVAPQNAVNKSDHLGNIEGNMSTESKIPYNEINSTKEYRDLNITNIDKILYSSNASRTSNASFLLPKHSSSNLYKTCKFEDALVVYDGKCNLLLRQGPCSVNQWLLINDEDVPYCAPRPCQKGELLYNDNCVNISDASVCGVSEVLYVDFSGEVYCDCLPYYYVYDTKARQCFAENDQGSCPNGEVLEIISNNNLICVKNQCESDKYVYNPSNKRCYKKGYIGSCKEENEDIIVFIEKDQTATCVNTDNRNYLKTRAVKSCPFGSKRQNQNKCPKPFKKNRNSPRQYSVSSQNLSKQYPCPPGFTEYPGPSCKKINNLLLG